MMGHLGRRAAGLAALMLLTTVAAAAPAADLAGRRPPPPILSPSEPDQAAAVLAQATEEPPVEQGPVEQAPVEAEAPVEAAPADAPPKTPQFLRRSGSRAGGPANELNTGDERAKESLPGGSVTRMLSGRDLYHGNFCGPGDRGAGLEPTDALDAICQRHDACYTAAGHRSCGCDRELRTAALNAAADNALSRVLRARAASVAESIPFMNCSEP